MKVPAIEFKKLYTFCRGKNVTKDGTRLFTFLRLFNKSLKETVCTKMDHKLYREVMDQESEFFKTLAVNNIYIHMYVHTHPNLDLQLSAALGTGEALDVVESAHC